MCRLSPKVAPGAKSDFWSPKVTFSLQKWFWTPKVTFGVQKSLFRSKSGFPRFGPPRTIGIYKDYVGFAAVARTGAKNAKFTEFCEKVTSGAKMSPKVTFCDFGVPKVTCRAQALRCACSHQFLDTFFGPREQKCHFLAQMSIFALL